MNLQIKRLSKIYPNGVIALNNLSIDIGVGMFGLLGPNGAGKSTFMRTLATLQSPDSGSIHFEGIDVLKNPFALRKQLGYLPQSFGVYPKQSARRLLNYFAVLKGIPTQAERSLVVEEVLEKTNLLDHQNQHVSDFSGGMKQRFGIAQLLLNNPRLIIVDEPTAGLDPAERKRFLNVLRALASEHTVIFSSHIVEDVSELCSDMAIINKGKIIDRGSPREMIQKLTGQIWRKKVGVDQYAAIKSRYPVISSSMSEDNDLLLRIFSPNQPDSLSVAANPRLEDVYFITLEGMN